MAHYVEVIMVFLIMFSSTLLEKSTFINLSLEKSENIKDFLDIFNHFFHFFFKVMYTLWVQFTK